MQHVRESIIYFEQSQVFSDIQIKQKAWSGNFDSSSINIMISHRNGHSTTSNSAEKQPIREFPVKIGILAESKILKFIQQKTSLTPKDTFMMILANKYSPTRFHNLDFKKLFKKLFILIKIEFVNLRLARPMKNKIFY